MSQLNMWRERNNRNNTGLSEVKWQYVIAFLALDRRQRQARIIEMAPF